MDPLSPDVVTDSAQHLMTGKRPRPEDSPLAGITSPSITTDLPSTESAIPIDSTLTAVVEKTEEEGVIDIVDVGVTTATALDGVEEVKEPAPRDTTSVPISIDAVSSSVDRLEVSARSSGPIFGAAFGASFAARSSAAGGGGGGGGGAWGVAKEAGSIPISSGGGGGWATTTTAATTTAAGWGSEAASGGGPNPWLSASASVATGSAQGIEIGSGGGGWGKTAAAERRDAPEENAAVTDGGLVGGGGDAECSDELISNEEHNAALLADTAGGAARVAILTGSETGQRTGEEDDVTLTQIRGKLFVADTGAGSRWRECGVGPVRVNVRRDVARFLPASYVRERVSNLLPGVAAALERAFSSSSSSSSSPPPPLLAGAAARLIIRQEHHTGGHGSRLLLNAALADPCRPNMHPQQDRAIAFRALAERPARMNGDGGESGGAASGAAGGVGVETSTSAGGPVVEENATDTLTSVSSGSNTWAIHSFLLKVATPEKATELLDALSHARAASDRAAEEVKAAIAKATAAAAEQ